jgi:hypothetical protein
MNDTTFTTSQTLNYQLVGEPWIAEGSDASGGERLLAGDVGGGRGL